MSSQSSSDRIERIVDNIEKSINDSLVYRGLVLKNGLTALLISDPDTDKSAASLSVAVGSLNEPKNLPGFARLCERMLFLGSEKYPEKFSKFLKQHDGSFEKCTLNDHTDYFFSIKTESFQPALDRFAQYLFDPLFMTNAIERSINSMYEESVADDLHRLEQVEQNLAGPNHAYNIFGTGSKETLWCIPNSKNIDVLNLLLEFHYKWYSSHLMYLTVLGKEELSTLEELVVSLFGDIEKKYLGIPFWSDPIYKEEQLPTGTIIVPLKDTSILNVKFQIPDLSKNHISWPTKYLRALFEYQGPSSVFSVLKKRDWSRNLLAMKMFKARGIEVFSINVYLTKKGVDHVDDIIKLIFQYINLLKREGPIEWLHDENKKISAMKFQFKDKESPLNYVYRLSSRLIKYKLEDVLTAKKLAQEWRPELIQELLSHFSPDNIRVIIVSKVFQNKTDSVDKYYGTQYSSRKIPVETLNEWKIDDLCEDLKLPLKNEFIATDFSLVPIDKNELNYPFIMHESSVLRCWYKIDTVFRVPKAFVSINFFSNIVKIDPININIMNIFIRLFKEDFTLCISDASRACFELNIIPSDEGFKIEISGFNHKMHILLKKTIEKLLNFKIDPQNFDGQKENVIKELKNIEKEETFLIAMRCVSIILSEVAWTPSDLLKTIEYIKVEDIQDFVNKFFSNMFMEALVYGNMDISDAKELIQIIETPFLGCSDTCKLIPRYIIRSREVQLENGENLLFEKICDPDSNSCIYIYFQCGVQSVMKYYIARLFNEILSKPHINILDTQEEDEFKLFSLAVKSNGILHLGIFIESDHTPMYVDTKIENYLSTIKELITNMSDADFIKYKDVLLAEIFKKPESLMKQAEVYQLEIDVQEYNFNQALTEAFVLSKIVKNDVIKFYNDRISLSGPKRRKLIAYIKNPTETTIKSSPKDSNLLPNNSLIITDITDFKKKHSLYPLQGPLIRVGFSSTNSKLRSD